MAQDKKWEWSQHGWNKVLAADNVETLSNAAGLVAVGNAVYLSAASTVTKATAASGHKFHGIVIELVSTTSCRVLTFGPIAAFSSGMTAGTWYYLGAAGALTTTLGEQPVGYALSATDLMVCPIKLPTTVGFSNQQIADPGDAGAIPVTSGGAVPLVSGAAGETRTLAIPTYVGQELTIYFKTDGGGDVAVTVASAINKAGHTIITFTAAGEAITLRGVYNGTALAWRILQNDMLAADTAVATTMVTIPTMLPTMAAAYTVLKAGPSLRSALS